MTRTLLVAGSLVAAVFAAHGCTDDGGGGHVAPGSGGSNAGTAGASGGGAGNGGTAGSGNPNFMAVAPCNAEGDYMSGATVTFPMSATNFSYSPKCLKVTAGTTVTFSGDFTAHPLEPSTHRGTLTGNPITATASGSTKAFAFPSPGYYAYFCSVHGPSDGSAGMVGVVWVE